MQQIIKQTTEYYLSALPDDKEFYHLSDFKSENYPPFLVHRLQLALFQELLQTVSPPQTQWADVKDKAVVESWQQFIRSLKGAIYVPADKFEPILRQAVTDIIHSLVQPRQWIPDLLFEEDQTLTSEQLSKRTKWLVVYPHFGQVLSRYMQRKDKNELTRRQCEAIVTKVDEKITRNYTPFQWGEMLQPLFELTSSSVEADLFRLVFDDREMDQFAQKFASLDLGLTRDGFIDLLIKKQEDERNMIEEKVVDETTDVSPEAQKDEGDNEEQGPIPIEIESGDENTYADEQTDEHDEGQEAKPNPGSINESASRDAEINEKNKITDERPHNSDLHSGTDQPDEQEEASVSLNDIFTDESDSEEGEKKITDDETLEDQTNNVSEQVEDSNEVPMWQRFTDQSEVEEVLQPNRDPEEQQPAVKQYQLSEHLQEQESYFVQTLFDGSKLNYLNALERINERDGWKEAYQLVEQEIFNPNDINIYSEAAVDFTDRLQNYFIDSNN